MLCHFKESISIPLPESLCNTQRQDQTRTMYGLLGHEKYTDFQEVPQQEEDEEGRTPSKPGSSSCWVLSLLVIVPIITFLLGTLLGSHFPFDFSRRCLQRTSQYCTPSRSSICIAHELTEIKLPSYHRRECRTTKSISVALCSTRTSTARTQAPK